MSRALPYLWYPLLFAGAIVAFAAMLAAGVTLVVATYLPTLVAGLAIVALELQFPERLEWRPRRADVAADVAFMALVQILLQRVLLVLAVFAIATWMHGHAPSPWWPHGWTLGAQMVAMLLAVDFMRYWLHRACHTYTPLWRLHAVHHSPDILYSLNVGRFHPLEKIAAFRLDSVPFILLGVAPEVIAGYFVLYAANGFFQHSNVRLRYGWLNYVVGSAETHRWHHARDPRTAYCNFGSTTAVWDLLFGTWYLPSRGPGTLGIMDTTYPEGLLRAAVAPFRAAAPARRRRQASRRRQHSATCGSCCSSRAGGLRASRAIRCASRTRCSPGILRENRGTAFGQRHGFAAIASYEDFARAVPVMEFEALAALHRRGNRTRRKRLDAARRPRHTFAPAAPPAGPRTSRSSPRISAALRPSSAVGRVPVPRFAPRHSTAAFSRSSARLRRARCRTASRSVPLPASSPATRRGWCRQKFVLPADVFTIADSRVKYLLILRLALAHRDITYFGTANATTLLALMQLYREHRPS